MGNAVFIMVDRVIYIFHDVIILVKTPAFFPWQQNFGNYDSKRSRHNF